MAGADPRRSRAGGGSPRDRLSALPDELLLRVISFLPAQQVVQTTVLSKRWTDLWRYVPCIEVRFYDFRTRSEERAETMQRVEDFTNNLLMLHRAPRLDAFRLNLDAHRPHETLVDHNRRRHVDRWVRRAIKDDPLVIEVSVPCDSYQLPHLGFSPSRRLRRLHLSGVSLKHSFTERLHSWWPDLKDLSLRYCYTEFSSIESDRLENLDIYYCKNQSPDVFGLEFHKLNKLVDYDCNNQPPDVFTIRAPRLASLSVHLGMPFSLDVNSLVRASISLNPVDSPRSGAMILGSLFNVTSFQLQGFPAMAALNEEFDAVPIFQNLRTLSLESCFNIDTTGVCKFNDLGRFLQKTPNLEKLTLKGFKVVPVVEHVDFPILKNLRTLRLRFCDLDDNFQILLNCLQNSPNLEKLEITRCKLSDDSIGGKGKAKSRMKLACFRCLKLEYAKIFRCEEDAGVPELVSFLLDFAAPTITIKVSSL